MLNPQASLGFFNPKIEAKLLQCMDLRSWDVLHGNCNAFATEATSYFIVYSCVASPLACMSKPSYFPILHVSPYYLRIAC